MAGSQTIERRAVRPGPDTEAGPATEAAWTDWLEARLAPLASLRLTVALLAMAIFIVFVGTLAQVYKDMWEVIADYFRTPIALVEWRVFFPPSFFPFSAEVDWNALPVRGFYFPGGALIGALLAANLAAAHAFRFKVEARGVRRTAGWTALAAGVLVTWLVIQTGHNPHGLQDRPLLEWSTLWRLIQASTMGVTLAAAAGFVRLLLRSGGRRKLELFGLGAATLLLAALSGWLVTRGEQAALSASSLRILWQLIKGELAAAFLLLGCWLLFRRRAGLALLHAGVGLMMFGELFVSLYAVEQRMTIPEGETVGYARDLRQVELAVIDPSPKDHDQVVAIPMAAHGKPTAYARGRIVDHDALPFRIEVLEYHQNADVRPLPAGEAGRATAGFGRRWTIAPLRPAAGVGRSEVDMAAAYVRLTDKRTGEDLGVYLLSQLLAAQNYADVVACGGKTYQLQLRFHRQYKPYKITALDVRKDDYLGTSTPRNYSTTVRLVDPSRRMDFQQKIWMNNPLRYAGETFYQSGYSVRNGVEVTDLQVVRNTGWLIPYVACMIVGTGMLTHFGVVLTRFLGRVQRGGGDGEPAGGGSPRTLSASGPGGRGRRRRAERRRGAEARSPASWLLRWAAPAAVVLAFGGWLAAKARPPRTPAGQMPLEAFGRLPLVFEGRVKPFDSLARNSLRLISNRETFTDGAGRRQPAIRWLLDLITGDPAADDARVFRIDSLEVLQTFQLEPRPGFRYAFSELLPHAEAYEKQVREAFQLAADQRTFYQRKLLELERRVRRYRLLREAFRPLDVPPLPTADQLQRDPQGAKEQIQRIQQLLGMIGQFQQRVAAMQPPLAVPAPDVDPPWRPYATAKTLDYVLRLRQRPGDPAVAALDKIFDAYRNRDPVGFAQAAADYSRWLRENPPEGLNMRRVAFEAYFNQVAPFYRAAGLYALALLAIPLAWLAALAAPRVSLLLRRSAVGLIGLALAIHFLAVLGRIYISGRPPVTNLYSSAVFIGLACVLLGMILEAVFRLGLGAFAAAAAGVATLMIAHFLSADGDTLTVLQAVLDTQFWLSTHVVTIAMGYSATFLAGLLGVLYILAGAATPALTAERSGMLKRMIYGVLCFAILFSFVGTVLGGLWADDSWGRFWGWDPKENGALIIVLWNALVLHAHWGRMVKERGLAVLAVGGNIVTAWSWFGVNELGIGLHSYGFTEGVLLTLGLFVLSQLAVMAVGLAPLRWWWSGRVGLAPDS